MNAYNPLPFPVECLPASVKNAVLEMQTNTGFPIPLIAASALGTLSAVCQNLSDVLPPVGNVSPISLNILSIADIGEGKTPTDKYFQQPIREFEEAERKKSEDEMECLKTSKKTWEIEFKAIETGIKKNRTKFVTSDDSDEIEQLSLDFEKLEQKLEEHLLKEPKQRKRYKMIQSDTTPTKIALDLSANIPSAYLSSDEAGSLFKGSSMKNLGMLNQLWDGTPLNLERMDRNIQVEDGRLSIFLAVQGAVLNDYLNHRGKGARDIGFLARCLVSFPVSTKGTRFLTVQPQSWENLKIFQNRALEILNQDRQEIDNGRQERTVLVFSNEAKNQWINFRNNIEVNLAPGRFFEDVNDMASKITSNATRMAALFHLFEGNRGEISVETLKNAGYLCDWYINEFKRLFTKTPEMPVVISDAMELEKSLITWFQNHPGCSYMKKSAIAQYAPSKLRKDGCRREAAINELYRQNKIQIWLHEKIHWVVLNYYQTQTNVVAPYSSYSISMEI